MFSSTYLICLQVCVGVQDMNMTTCFLLLFFCLKACSLVYVLYRCVAECFMKDSLDRPGYNEIPGAERRQPVKQQMWLDSLSLHILPNSWQSCHSSGRTMSTRGGGLWCRPEDGWTLWRKRRQSPGLTPDSTACRSPNKADWQLKHRKCQQFYHTRDVMMMMMMMRPYTSTTDAAVQKQVE